MQETQEMWVQSLGQEDPLEKDCIAEGSHLPELVLYISTGGVAPKQGCLPYGGILNSASACKSESVINMIARMSQVDQSVQFSLSAVDCSMPGFLVHHHLLDFAQTHVCWVGDAIQPSHPLSSPSPPAFNLSQHWSIFQWVGSSHQVVKVLELQHQSSQWIFRVDFL